MDVRVYKEEPKSFLECSACCAHARQRLALRRNDAPSTLPADASVSWQGRGRSPRASASATAVGSSHTAIRCRGKARGPKNKCRHRGAATGAESFLSSLRCGLLLQASGTYRQNEHFGADPRCRSTEVPWHLALRRGTEKA
jgi:hypothetical protein